MLLNVNQAAAYLGLSIRIFRALRQAGRGPDFVFLSGPRFTKEALDAWMERNRVDGKDAARVG